MYFHFNSMFFVNFQHYYTLCFRACASWSNKIIDFDLLAVLLYLFPTRVGEICARTSIINVNSCSFIARSFSLTVNSHKRIQFLFTSRDNGHRHQTPRLLLAYCSLMALFGYPETAGSSSYSGTQQCHQRLCANIPRISSLVGVPLSARGSRENTVFASQDGAYSMEFVKSQNALFLPLFIPLFLSHFIPSIFLSTVLL
jgi:hypothetical protein